MTFYESEAAISAVSAADAARRSSIAPGRSGECRPRFRPVVCRNTRIALALLDDPPVKLALHCFVASKAPWFEIEGDLPQYPDYPPPG